MDNTERNLHKNDRKDAPNTLFYTAVIPKPQLYKVTLIVGSINIERTIYIVANSVGNVENTLLNEYPVYDLVMIEHIKGKVYVNL